MYALFIKEVRGFFSNLSGLVAIGLFLLVSGLFLWVFPGEWNIPDSGLAHMDGFFSLAPFLFLFLIPAISMRSIAGERQAGTLELLMCRPVSAIRLLFAKYMAALVILVLALVPTLIYFFSISWFSSAPGPDTGGIFGAYLGLLFLAMAFLAIGIFASAFSSNQGLAFLFSFIISASLYLAPGLIAIRIDSGTLAHYIQAIGMQHHYLSLGRGVLDSRDLIYFLVLIFLFLWASLLFVEKRLMRAVKPLRLTARAVLLVIALLVISLVSSNWFFRLDLTREKRHSLSTATINLLRGLKEPVYIQVYLEGDLPLAFRQFRQETIEMLDAFAAYSPALRYVFIDPAEIPDQQEKEALYTHLIDKGLIPRQIREQRGGSASQRLVFPGALLSKGDRELAVQLIQDQAGLPASQVLNRSSQLLEYNLISAIARLQQESRPRVGLLRGRGGLRPERLGGLVADLDAYFEFYRVNPEAGYEELNEFDAIILTGASEPFTEKEKFRLDQYVMQGGKMLWLINPVLASLDSLRPPDYQSLALGWMHGLEDLFFRYGFRINPGLVQDLRAAPLPVTTAPQGGTSAISLLPWPFFPLLEPASAHPVVNNLNLVRSEFVSSIDTIELPGIAKYALLQSSAYSREQSVPVTYGLDIIENPPAESLFSEGSFTTALLLEGSFSGLYASRGIPAGLDLPDNYKPLTQSLPTAMIVVSSPSVLASQLDASGMPYALGYDRFSGQQFGNLDFALNCLLYLTGDAGLMQARMRKLSVRKLDTRRMQPNIGLLIWVNVGLPLVIVILGGLGFAMVRRRRYSGVFPADKNRNNPMTG